VGGDFHLVLCSFLQNLILNCSERQQSLASVVFKHLNSTNYAFVECKNGEMKELITNKLKMNFH